MTYENNNCQISQIVNPGGWCSTNCWKLSSLCFYQITLITIKLEENILHVFAFHDLLWKNHPIWS